MLAYALTFSRLALAAAFAAVTAVVAPDPAGDAAVAALLALAVAAELTDMLDGWSARRAGTASELGGLFDPLCDSLARLTMYFALALAGWVWLAVPMVMTGRDIIVAYVRVVLARTGGRTSARLSGKLKAIVQGAGVLVLVLLASRRLWPGDGDDLASAGARLNVACARVLTALGVIAITLWSLVDYIRGGVPAIRRLASRNRHG